MARSVHGDNVDPSLLLEIMNSAIYQSAKRKFVMTCFASTVDIKKRTITYANAGHNFPYLYRTGEGGQGEFGSLMIRGNRLGDLKAAPFRDIWQNGAYRDFRRKILIGRSEIDICTNCTEGCKVWRR